MPFEHPEAERHEGVEVAPEHVAVERVHDDGRTCTTGQQCGDTADGPGLRRVRMQDGRAFALDQLGEPEDGARVPQGADVPVQLVDHLGGHASGVRDEGHGLLPAADGTCGERAVVPPLGEAGRHVGEQ